MQAARGTPGFVSRDEELALVRRYVSAPNVRIIEAGCGRRWPQQLANPTAVLIGIDCDEAALALRNDLTEKHTGDVRTIGLPRESADVVYSYYVLEHVQHADQALANFVSWLRPGGVLIIGVPDRDSVYGFLTRMTPHWFHVFYKKYVDRYTRAGQPGFGPYPTYHEPVISLRGLRDFCAAHDCEVLHELKTCYYLTSGKSRGVKKLVAMVVSALSLGKLSWRHDNLCVIVRKNAHDAQRRAAPVAR
jgi:SAM-dependent methyltransferase